MFLHKSYNKNLMPFLRYKDSITASWYLSDIYEKSLNNCIDLFVKDEYNDFFIDIGANIGLTTIQNYQKFDNIFCFEPNEIVFNILKTNVKISCSEIDKISLFNVGLGLKRGQFNLFIPRNNFGGAFVKENNSYNLKTLSKKDGLKSFDEKNYFNEKVTIEDQIFLEKKVYSHLAKNMKGIIKIDVEGYEFQIIELLMGSFPCEKFIIIFENWKDLQIENLRKALDTKKSLKYQLFSINKPKFFKKKLSEILPSKLTKIDNKDELIPGGNDIVISFF